MHERQRTVADGPGPDPQPDAAEPAAAPVVGRGLMGHVTATPYVAELARSAQAAGGNALLSRAVLARRPKGPAPPKLAPEVPGTHLEEVIGRLRGQALPALQAALDAPDGQAVRAAGMRALALWEAVEGQAVPLTQTGGEPPQEYIDAREAVLTAFGAVRFRGRAAPDPPPVQDEGAELSSFIHRRTDELGAMAGDVVTMLGILSQDPVPEADGDRLVDLMHAHQPPWEFAYVREALIGLDRWKLLLKLPQKQVIRLGELVIASHEIAKQGLSPGEEVGLFEMLPADRKVRLLQPLTPAEVAEALYGSSSRWKDVIEPLNRMTLAASSLRNWLPVGTELLVEPNVLLPQYRVIFRVSEKAAGELKEKEGKPYIKPSSPGTVAIGNTVKYALHAPQPLPDNLWINWKVQRGGGGTDTGSARASRGRTGDVDVFSVEIEDAGLHTVSCNAQADVDGEYYDFGEASNVALSATERSAVEFSRHLDWKMSPDELKATLEKKLAEAKDDDARDKIKKQLGDLKTAQGEAGLFPLKAVYVSAEDEAVTFPLVLYVGLEPGYGDEKRLQLWDFTLQQTRTQAESGATMADAFIKLLEEFADDAPYPDGVIRFQVSPAVLPPPGAFEIPRRDFVFETDGGTALATILRGLSAAALAIGVGAAFLGQVEIAVPMMLLSGALAGAAGVANIADRLEHGMFEWDLESALDVVDIAAALITAGAASAVTTTARGVGKVSLLARLPKYADYAQIAVMAGVHSAAIGAAVASGDMDKVERAVLGALRDGAILLVVHRAGKRIQADLAARSGGGDPGAPTARPDDPGGPAKQHGDPDAPAPRTGVPDPPAPRPDVASGGGKTAAGTVKGGPPQTGGGQPHAPAPDIEPPRGTPEHHRWRHEQWIKTADLSSRPAPPPATGLPPLPERHLYADHIPDPEQAMRVYDMAYSRAGGKEVGLFRNARDGTYAVMVGTPHGVDAPAGRGPWEGVLHRHPNQGNILTLRNPAPADVADTAMRAFQAEKPITEIVEHDLPDGTRGRTRYTVQPTYPFEVTVEFLKPDGTVETRPYPSLQEYARAYGERTLYLDPADPLYKWVMADLGVVPAQGAGAVSYTHLDVYKRQPQAGRDGGDAPLPEPAGVRARLRRADALPRSGRPALQVGDGGPGRGPGAGRGRDAPHGDGRGAGDGAGERAGGPQAHLAGPGPGGAAGDVGDRGEGPEEGEARSGRPEDGAAGRRPHHGEAHLHDRRRAGGSGAPDVEDQARPGRGEGGPGRARHPAGSHGRDPVRRSRPGGPRGERRPRRAPRRGGEVPEGRALRRRGEHGGHGRPQAPGRDGLRRGSPDRHGDPYRGPHQGDRGGQVERRRLGGPDGVPGPVTRVRSGRAAPSAGRWSWRASPR